MINQLSRVFANISVHDAGVNSSPSAKNALGTAVANATNNPNTTPNAARSFATAAGHADVAVRAGTPLPVDSEFTLLIDNLKGTTDKDFVIFDTAGVYKSKMKIQAETLLDVTTVGWAGGTNALKSMLQGNSFLQIANFHIKVVRSTDATTTSSAGFFNTPLEFFQGSFGGGQGQFSSLKMGALDSRSDYNSDSADLVLDTFQGYVDYNSAMYGSCPAGTAIYLTVKPLGVGSN